MDPYDVQAVSAVWKRVHAGRDDDTLEQALIEAICFEKHSMCAYLQMAKCSGNMLFQKLATREHCHVKKLSTLYYLLYECPPCQHRQNSARIDDFCEAVRQAYRGELTAAERYEKLAVQHPAHRELFCALAKEEKCHAEQLRGFAERFLHC